MTEVYPPVARWAIPEAALEATLRGLRRAGQRGREGGALWFGDRASEARILAVASANGEGVHEREGSWSLSEAAYGRIGEWALSRGCALLGLVHSHGGAGLLATTLSPTDKFSTVHVPDFLSVVVGRRGGEADARAWGFHVFERGHFRRLEAAEVAERIVWFVGPVEHFRFDEKVVEPFVE